MLILGSFGFRDLRVRGKLGELLPDRTGTMLIIPLACMFEQETAEKEKTGAVLLGFRQENIHIFDSEHPAALPDMHFDYITVLGGNTFQLLARVREFGLDSLIRQQVGEGAVYLGFSAGAYLACPDIEYVKNFDDNNTITNEDYSALHLTEKYVLCHFDHRGSAEIRMCRWFIGEAPELITITDDELVVL